MDLATGTIHNLTTGARWQARPIPPFMAEIFAAGGLVNYTRQRLAAQGAAGGGE